jgi:hypothetical protein
MNVAKLWDSHITGMSDLKVKCIKLIVKYFFSRCFIFRAHLRFGYIHFPLADVFFGRGHLRLESSCIWVNTVYPHTHIHVIHIVPFQWVIELYPGCNSCHSCGTCWGRLWPLWVHCDRILMFYWKVISLGMSDLPWAKLYVLKIAAILVVPWIVESSGWVRLNCRRGHLSGWNLVVVHGIGSCIGCLLHIRKCKLKVRFVYL